MRWQHLVPSNRHESPIDAMHSGDGGLLTWPEISPSPFCAFPLPLPLLCSVPCLDMNLTPRCCTQGHHVISTGAAPIAASLHPKSCHARTTVSVS